MLIRSRRLRTTAAIRDLVAETELLPRHLIQGHFVQPQAGSTEIASLPGISRNGVEATVRQVEADLKLGLRSHLLFGVPDSKDKAPDAHAAHDHDGIVPQAVRALKKEFGNDVVVMTDVCLCAYTDTGHCGINDGPVIRNDESVAILARMAVAHAEAGADVVAPSDMMDGRIRAMREALDDAGFIQTMIMSYAIKHAGAYYGPFRDAADSSPKFGDRRSYQMDPRNAREGLKDGLMDVEEGADVLLVKPAMPNLDLIWRLREKVLCPIAAYHVSSEYSSVKAGARMGWIDEANLFREHLTAIRRAGADWIVTYAAREGLSKKWF
ncbi:MAG TPA: porphobilinogen synthase [Holophaga sp.]|nr:porphobilinogen synthase [Holophaga sp.]